MALKSGHQPTAVRTTGGDRLLNGYRQMIEVARDLASTLDLNSLLDRIIRAAVDITRAKAASILLYDDAARQLNFQVTTNLDLQTMRGLIVPLEGSIAGWVVTHRQAVRIPHAHADPRFYSEVEAITRFSTESLLGVPLIAKDRIVGVLEAINKPEGPFTDDDEDLLQVLSAQAAVAIENARLFQQSDLIAEFVHELRTPLTSIGTAATLLLRPDTSPELAQAMIKNIHGETLRLNTLATAFLDLARLESGRVPFNLRLFPLQDMLEECLQGMQPSAAESGITLQVVVPPDFPPVEADRDKLKQVVLNLLSNAIKYNNPGGVVTVSAAVRPGEWTLTVQDTGIGIPEKARAHLFEKFYRVQGSPSKVPGTGLGLSICKQIVSGHGGSIEVHSRLGEGTRFILHIPVKKP
jgi:signal transduction histidine kinase